MVTKYYVLEANSIRELIKLTNTAIDDGWQPIGGICAVGGKATGNGHAYYFQSLVSTREKDSTVPQQTN